MFTESPRTVLRKPLASLNKTKNLKIKKIKKGEKKTEKGELSHIILWQQLDFQW